MTTENFKKKPLVQDIENITTADLHFDTSDDKSILEKEEFNWDKLEELKEDLGKNIIEFIMQVNDIINNEEIQGKLGEKQDYFEKVVNVFFTDINNFSTKIKAVREKHDGLTGPVEKIEDLDLYNNIVIQYQYLFSELATLITPTLSEIMIVISELGLDDEDKEEVPDAETEVTEESITEDEQSDVEDGTDNQLEENQEIVEETKEEEVYDVETEVVEESDTEDEQSDAEDEMDEVEIEETKEG